MARLSPSSELTDELIRDACAIIRDGNFRTIAFARLGIPTYTWSSWVKRGNHELKDVAAGRKKESDLTLKAKMCLELNAAEAECHEELLLDVLSNGSPELKMKFLQRRYGKLYSNNPNAIEDESGEEVQRSAVDILAEKLANFVVEDE